MLCRSTSGRATTSACWQPAKCAALEKPTPYPAATNVSIRPWVVMYSSTIGRTSNDRNRRSRCCLAAFTALWIAQHQRVSHHFFQRYLLEDQQRMSCGQCDHQWVYPHSVAMIPAPTSSIIAKPASNKSEFNPCTSWAIGISDRRMFTCGASCRHSASNVDNRDRPMSPASAMRSVS